MKKLTLRVLTIIISFLLFSACQQDDESYITNDNSDTATKTGNESDTSSSSSEVSNGYVLYAINNSHTTHLIDMDGSDLKTWISNYKAIGGSYLSSNKTLLRSGVSNSLNSTILATQFS